METTHKIGIAALVLAGLSGLAYTQQQKDAKMGTDKAASENMPEIKLTAEGEINKLSLTNGEKGEVVLVKSGDKWMVEKPVKAPANQANVKSLLDNMKEIEASELIASNSTDDIKKSYELNAEKAVHAAAFKGDEKKFDMSFGKFGSRGQMGILTSKSNKIYAIKKYSGYLYGREVKEWRDREIVKFEDSAVVSLTIAKKEGAMVFTKGEGDKWTGTASGRTIERFDADKAKDAIRNFKFLSAEDFADEKTEAEMGLGTPESTVTIQLKDTKYVLKFGAKTTSGGRYARKEGDSTNFIVSSFSAEWAVAEMSKFQTPLDAGAPKK